MPCYVTGSAEGDARLSAQEAHTELLELTRILCGLMQRLESANELGRATSAARAWWKTHKKKDEDRRKSDASYRLSEILRLKKELAKLTSEI